MNTSSLVKVTLLAVLCAVLPACADKDDEHEPSAVEAAGKELGQAVSRDLKEEIDQAKALEKQLQQDAENLDRQIEQQVNEPAAEQPTEP